MPADLSQAQASPTEHHNLNGKRNTTCKSFVKEISNASEPASNEDDPKERNPNSAKRHICLKNHFCFRSAKT